MTVSFCITVNVNVDVPDMTIAEAEELEESDSKAFKNLVDTWKVQAWEEIRENNLVSWDEELIEWED